MQYKNQHAVLLAGLAQWQTMTPITYVNPHNRPAVQTKSFACTTSELSPMSPGPDFVADGAGTHFVTKIAAWFPALP